MSESTRGVFRDGEHARQYLGERLARLEAAVRDASDVARTATSMTADAMAGLEADPLAFRKVATVHLRDLMVDVTESASRRTDTEGIDEEALREATLLALGHGVDHGADVLRGMSRALRERIERLGVAAQIETDDARSELDNALLALDRSLDRVVRRWEEEPIGWWARRSRRRKLGRFGLENVAQLPELALGLADAAREHRAAFDVAWGHAAEASVSLGIAGALGKPLEWITAILSGLETAAAHAEEMARDAEAERDRMLADRPASRETDRVDLLDPDLLDRALEALGIDAPRFLSRTDLDLATLARQTRRSLEADLRSWIEGELLRLPEPTLRHALGRFAPEADLVGPLVDLLADGQPLLEFNDDFHRLWVEGEPVQYHVFVECSDDTVDVPCREACLQVGLPEPRIDRPPDGGTSGPIRIRALQLVAGLAWLSEAQRLAPMAELHDAFLADADARLPEAGGHLVALRDTLESETLVPVVPEEVRVALRELKGL